MRGKGSMKQTKKRTSVTNAPREKERTLVSFDWAMKYILRDKANFDVLEGFLSTLLEQDIRILALLESESNQKQENIKYNRVDLAVTDEFGEVMLIEIQHDLDIHYLRRLLYGTAKLITDHLKAGKPYAQVRKVISISILYFQVEEKPEDYLYHGYTEFYGWHTKRPMRKQLIEKKQREKAPQRLWMENDAPAIFPEYYLIDVSSFQNTIQSAIDEWVYFFKNSEIRQEFQAKNIQAAREKLDFLKMSESDQQDYERFMFDRAKDESTVQSAWLQGITAGKAEGKAEGTEETLRQVLPLMAQLRFGNDLPADLPAQLQACTLVTLQRLQATIQSSATLEEWLALLR
jgi:predicted transposase/invertase (TIGR01784 family)